MPTTDQTGSDGQYRVLPVAPGWPLIGRLPFLLINLIRDLRRMRAKHGGLAAFKILHRDAVLIASPEAVKCVLTRGEPDVSKGPLTDVMRASFGDALALTNGAHAKRQRKLLQPIFQNASVRQWQPIVNQAVNGAILQWEQKASRKGQIDAIKESATLIQNIMTQIMFGAALPEDLKRAAGAAVERLNAALIGEFFRCLALPEQLRDGALFGKGQFASAASNFDRIINAVLAAEQSVEGEHLIAQFRRARDKETGEAMSTKQLRDEVAAFFFAGQETTANTLAWTFYFLSQNTQIADRVAAEVQTVFGDDTPTFESLECLQYTRQVILETMRLRPAAYALERQAQSDIKIEGCPIKNHALLVVAPSVTHLDEEYWPNPDHFNPARFSKVEVRNRHPFAYFPFGGGARKCIGMQLAMMELTTIVAMLVRQFEFSLSSRANVREKIGVTLRPYPTIPILVKVRNATRSAVE